MTGYIEVGRFFHAEPMEACVSVINKAGIPSRIANDSQTTNLSVYFPGTISCGLVSVPKEQLIPARQALLKAAQAEVAAGVDPEHPLLACKDDELISLLEHPWENSDFDMACAQSILRDRGVTAPEVVFARADDVPESGGVPEEGIRRGPRTLLIYCLYTMLTAGLLGPIIAWNVAYATEVRPDGGKRYVYCQSTRTLGKWLLAFSVILCAGIILALIKYRLELDHVGFFLSGF
jgi:hypothetical protein